MIQASVIKGHCSIRRCCQFMFDVANGILLHDTKEKGMPVLSLDNIVINGVHFLFPNGEHTLLTSDTTSTEDCIWDLAALTMELYLGYPIFNGEGRKAQKAETPIPSIPNKEAKGLNLILSKCLTHNKSVVPTLQDIIAMVSNELDILPLEKRMPQQVNERKRQEMLNRIDRMWPDDFRKSIVTVLLMLFSISIGAQSVLHDKGEAQMASILDAVLTIKKGGEANWNAAKSVIVKHSRFFTLMDELKDKTNDCVMIKTQVEFLGINRMMNEIKRSHSVQNTGKDLLDGADPRFNYSIYEKGIKSKSVASYTLSGRSGRQVFVVIPYNPTQNYTVTIRINSKNYRPASKDKNGISYFFLDKGFKDKQTVNLSIENKEAHNASFVIANHNYRSTK